MVDALDHDITRLAAALSLTQRRRKPTSSSTSRPPCRRVAVRDHCPEHGGSSAVHRAFPAAARRRRRRGDDDQLRGTVRVQHVDVGRWRQRQNHRQVCTAGFLCSVSQRIAPRRRRDDTTPADGSSIQKSRRIYLRPRTGPQSARLWWPAAAKLQAARVPIA